MPDLKARYEGVLQRIEQAAKHAERHPEDVNLVVVTKNHPADLVLELIELVHGILVKIGTKRLGPRLLRSPPNPRLRLAGILWVNCRAIKRSRH